MQPELEAMKADIRVIVAKGGLNKLVTVSRENSAGLKLMVSEGNASENLYVFIPMDLANNRVVLAMAVNYLVTRLKYVIDASPDVGAKAVLLKEHMTSVTAAIDVITGKAAQLLQSTPVVADIPSGMVPLYGAVPGAKMVPLYKK